MLILNVYGNKAIQCDKVEKGTDFIKVYSGDEVVLWDSGISDFSGYSLIDEQRITMEFSVPEPEESEIGIAIRAVVTAMAEAGSISEPLAQTVMSRAMEIALAPAMPQ